MAKSTDLSNLPYRRQPELWSDLRPLRHKRHQLVAEMQGLILERGGRTVVDIETLAIPSGTIGLLGPNGAGKTTLLMALATLLYPASGNLEVFGYSTTSKAQRRHIRRHLGFLPQGFDPPPSFRAVDFVTYVAWTKETQNPIQAARIALEQVGLSDVAEDRIRTFSGGMKQRLGIAAAVVHRPSLLILDEPTVGLDPLQRHEFKTLINDMDGISILLSTHLTEDIEALCDTVIILSQGNVLYNGPLNSLIEGQNQLIARSLDSPIDLEQAYLNLVSREND